MNTSHPSDLLRNTLSQKTQLGSPGFNDEFDIIDVVPVPMHGDRMLRMRTIEEALNDFDQADAAGEGAVMSYFVQVRLKGKKPASADAPKADSKMMDYSGTPVYVPAPPIAAPTSQSTSSAAVTANAATLTGDQIYLNDGKLNTPFLLQSAELLYKSGDYTLARNIYKAIMSSGDKTATALLGIARCYEAEKKLVEAKHHYEESIAYHAHPEAYKALTSLLIKQKKDQEAAEVIERALHHRQLDENTRFDFHKTAGNCWGRASNLKEAERHYRKAIELKPNADEIMTNLGALNLQHGRAPEAEKYFHEALTANPRSHEALCGLGSCAIADGNKTAAHAWFARALQIEIKNPTAIYHLVKCAYEIKSYAVAAKIVEDYMQVAPINIHLLYSLAGLQFHLGRAEDARMTCYKIQQLNPEHGGAKALLTRIEEGFPNA